MSQSYYLAVPIVKGQNFKPIRNTLYEIGGFFTGICYAFPSTVESKLKELLAHLPVPILQQPLSDGQTFEMFQQNHIVAKRRDDIIFKEKEIEILKEKYKLNEFNEEIVKQSNLPDSIKQYALELLHEYEDLKKSYEWAEGMKKTISNSSQTGFSLKFVSEISKEYFTKKPADKPVLLYYEKTGDASAKKIPFLHKEITAMIVAEGGRGKTHLCANLAACVVTGIPFLGEFKVLNRGGVCLVVGENNESDIHRLLWKTREALEKLVKENEDKIKNKKPNPFTVDPDALKRLETHLCPLSVHGMNANLVDEKGKPTKFYNTLLNQLKDKEPEEGWQLIIFDPVSRFAGPESEKDNAIATAFISCLEHISASLKGTPTILLSHHKSKAGTKDSNGQTDARGASALVDGARWLAVLTKGEENDITIWELPKTNFTSPLQPFKIKKQFDGVPKFLKWGKE